MDRLVLTAEEEKLVACGFEGVEAVFDAKSPAVLRAEVIRRLLIGELQQTSSESPSADRRTTILSLCIRGADVSGQLNLRDCGVKENENDGLALTFDQCRFLDSQQACDANNELPPTVDLRNARVARVSFLECVIRHIALDGCSARGNIDLSSLHSDDDSTVCRVSARTMRSTGSFRIDGARLRFLPVDRDNPNRSQDYALDLKGTRIEGDLSIGNGFRAVGGVSLPAYVGGDVWMLGAKIRRASAKQNCALRAAGCHFDGSFVLRPVARGSTILRSYIRGPVDFFGLRVNGTLDLSGSIISKDRYSRSSSKPNLNMPYLKVDGGLTIGPKHEAIPGCDDVVLNNRISGGINIYGAQVGGSASVSPNTRLGSNATLNLSTGHYGGNLNLVSAETIQLGSTHVHGNLDIESRDDAVIDLYLTDSRIDRNLYFSGTFGEISIPGSEIKGQINQPHHATYQAEQIRAFETKIHGSTQFNVEKRLLLKDAEIHRQLLISSKSPAPGATLEGDLLFAARGARLIGCWNHVSLVNANFGGDVDLSRCSATLVRLDRAQISGNLTSPKHLFDRFSVEGGKIDGSVRFDNLKMHVRKRSEGYTAPNVSLEDCTITGDIKVRQLKREPQRDAVEEQSSAPEWLDSLDSFTLYSRELPWRAGVKIVELHRQTTESAGDPDSNETRTVVEAIAFLFAKEQTPRLLNGESRVLHEFNQRERLRSPLDFSTRDKVLDYLKFFCGYIWSDEGAFKILAPGIDYAWLQPDETSDSYTAELSIDRDGESWKCVATVAHGKGLFRSQFSVSPSGTVEMIDDEAVATLLDGIPEFDQPYRRYEQQQDGQRFWVFGEQRDWTQVSAEQEIQLFVRGVKDALTTTQKATVDGPKPGSVAKVNLQGCECGTMDDFHGREWKAGVCADLRGFTYRNLGEEATGLVKEMTDTDSAGNTPADLHGKAIANRRIAWLTKLLRHEGFSLQPYEQLYTAFRRRGDEAAAIQVLAHKMKLVTRRRHVGIRVMHLIALEWPFLYGLSSLRAIGSAMLYLLIGTYAFDFANSGVFRYLPVGAPVSEEASAPPRVPMLVVDSQPVTIFMEKRETVLKPVFLTGNPKPSRVEEVRCGDQIEPTLYALDVMLPILDLHQEEKCAISSRDDGATLSWRIFKALYAIIGAYVSSMLVLTVSGILRRNVEK